MDFIEELKSSTAEKIPAEYTAQLKRVIDRTVQDIAAGVMESIKSRYSSKDSRLYPMSKEFCVFPSTSTIKTVLINIFQVT